MRTSKLNADELAEIIRRDADELGSTGNSDAVFTASQLQRDRRKLLAHIAAVEAERDNAVACMRSAWQALALIRNAIEQVAPVGTVDNSEYLEPTPFYEAEALIRGITALTVELQEAQLQAVAAFGQAQDARPGVVADANDGSGPAMSIDDAEFGMREHRKHREALNTAAPSARGER